MSRSFSSFGAAANYVRTSMRANVKRQLTGSLTQVAQAVQNEAMSSMGTLQNGIGPYQRWEPLKDSTKARKARGGFSRPDDPLIRTGDYQKSIAYRINRTTLTATIGTSKTYAIQQELGNARNGTPPRQVFGPAALRVLPGEIKRVQQGTVIGLLGVQAGTFANGQNLNSHLVIP